MGLFGKKKKDEDDLPLLADDLPPLPALPKKNEDARMPGNESSSFFFFPNKPIGFHR
jgi:hypothetical protein